MDRDTKEWVYSELFEDEDLDAEFDRHRRYEPPWFGFPPRLLALDLRRPFRPEFALWREGEVVERGRLGVDRRRVKSAAEAVLSLADAFADFCRERNLFGAYLALPDHLADAARAAPAAAILREADWCGMLVAPVAGGSDVAAAAAAAAAAVAAGEGAPFAPVARRRLAAAFGVTPRPGKRPRSGGPTARPA